MILMPRATIIPIDMFRARWMPIPPASSVRVRRRQGPKTTSRLGVLGDVSSVLARSVTRVGASQRMAQDHGTGGDGIGVDMAGGSRRQGWSIRFSSDEAWCRRARIRSSHRSPRRSMRCHRHRRRDGPRRQPASPLHPANGHEFLLASLAPVAVLRAYPANPNEPSVAARAAFGVGPLRNGMDDR
jgi:hypothetical protein